MSEGGKWIQQKFRCLPLRFLGTQQCGKCLKVSLLMHRIACCIWPSQNPQKEAQYLTGLLGFWKQCISHVIQWNFTGLTPSSEAPAMEEGWNGFEDSVPALAVWQCLWGLSSVLQAICDPHQQPVPGSPSPTARSIGPGINGAELRQVPLNLTPSDLLAQFLLPVKPEITDREGNYETLRTCVGDEGKMGNNGATEIRSQTTDLPGDLSTTKPCQWKTTKQFQ